MGRSAECLQDLVVLKFFSIIQPFSLGIVKNMHFGDLGFFVEWAGSQQWTFFKVRISICEIFGLYVGIGENCKSHIKYFKVKYFYKLFV